MSKFTTNYKNALKSILSAKKSIPALVVFTALCFIVLLSGPVFLACYAGHLGCPLWIVIPALILVEIFISAPLAKMLNSWGFKKFCKLTE